MKSRPVIDVNRDAQIVALWLGRPRNQRRSADIDAFHQWLVDYAPWLIRTPAGSVEHIRTLIRTHTIEGDGIRPTPAKRRRQRHQGRE
jgi:hypothetical protein